MMLPVVMAKDHTLAGCRWINFAQDAIIAPATLNVIKAASERHNFRICVI